MVNLFLNTTPDLLQTINTSFHDGIAENLAKAAHTLKPTLDVFGVENTYDLIRIIEQKAKRSELDLALGKHINQLNTTMELVFKELKLAYPIV
jgi:HPt (histidine-containing phosphotransfer) domain-containing protein